MAKIGLFAGLYQDKGIGHVVRTATLYQYMINNNLSDTFYLWSNDNEQAEIVLKKINIEVELAQPVMPILDLLMIDSPESEHILSDEHNSKPLIRLDYFNYTDKKVNAIVNLYNHEFGESPDQYNGDLYAGLKYTILKNEIIDSKIDSYSSKKAKKALIYFSGNDPNGNTIKSINFLKNKFLEIKVICPPQKNIQNYGFTSDRIEMVEITNNFGRHLNECDLFICGGGTSLLEGIYFGKPIIAIPQNDMESRFIKMISKEIQLFRLDEIDYIVENYEKIFCDIHQEYAKLVDGKGKARIASIIDNMVHGY